MNFKFFILFVFSFFVLSSQEDNKAIIDSIRFYINNSGTNNSIDFNTRLSYAIKAKELSQKNNIDSLLLKSLNNLASVYYQNDNQILYIKYNHQILKLADRINDTKSLALANKNLGYYYFNKLVDSAYYYNNKSEKLYRLLNDNLNTAIVLLDVAILQYNDKDYTGSELTSINGLSLLDNLEESKEIIKYKSFFYDKLGLVFRQLEQYEESIDYFKKALKMQKDIFDEGSIIINRQKNNLANTYRSSGQFGIAIEYYKQVLNTKGLFSENPSFYALVLDNYARSLYLSKKYDKLPGLYLKAIKICDSIGDSYNSIVINHHLAEYYFKKENKDSALHYAYKAKKFSEKYYKDDLLESLLWLSRIEDDSIAVRYYDSYIKLNDSLLKNERATRNKFTRIQYETEQIEQENKQIARERMWLLVISIILIIASLLLYIVITQRNKNKELKFVQEQQEANEEIYNLMLSQNESIEEARTIEKQRISEELHDGVLGRLFGTRLSLDSLNMNNSVEAIKTRAQYIDELKTIEQDIRKVSHELNTDFVSGSGFIDIIKTLVETQTSVYKLAYNLEHDAIIWEEVSNKTKIHIYRIIQEALHNIYKHANASTVNISFKLKKNVICLIIKDDGAGFNVNKAKSGIGLKNMNSRIKEIEGAISITSIQNVGTTVTIEAPIT
ncbi:tetratricopeptide repeat-containing sensor histidine kinase [Thalassobellus sediminis]|uniref:tetratricopeptide repeat-containing sensor histidine kinase n=1 Tax=Thalassobellus sediminis TaxID=3367753 RepID=UPI0037A7A070